MKEIPHCCFLFIVKCRQKRFGLEDAIRKNALRIGSWNSFNNSQE